MAGTDTTASLERKLATILSADVAGYSRLMAGDEEQTLRTFRGHREVFEKLVALHRGRVFNTAGDAILAEFSSAVEAVRCATEIQAALRTRNDHLPENRQVKFRIGVNLGDVMVQEQDLLGDGVNVAARLQTAAEPGGICISGSIFDQIRNKLSLSFKPLGEVNFKNVPQAVRVFSIAEVEGLGLLPSPEIKRSSARARVATWLAAAAALLFIVCGAGFWAYSEHQRNKPELARISAAPPATFEPPRTPLAAPNTAGAGNDGLYGGQICYGPSQVDPARCYRAQAIV
jgi:class 3 adenylate cyclase